MKCRSAMHKRDYQSFPAQARCLLMINQAISMQRSKRMHKEKDLCLNMNSRLAGKCWQSYLRLLWPRQHPKLNRTKALCHSLLNKLLKSINRKIPPWVIADWVHCHFSANEQLPFQLFFAFELLATHLF